MNQLPFDIPVTTTSGKGRGKKLGIPTINFMIPKNLQLPYGVYAGWLSIKSHKHPAAIHFGPRPQFSETDPSLEAYLIAGKVDNLTKEATLQFVKFIRTIQTFPTVNKMLAQIALDIKEVKQCLE